MTHRDGQSMHRRTKSTHIDSARVVTVTKAKRRGMQIVLFCVPAYRDRGRAVGRRGGRGAGIA
jgi:hypothetical protein